MVDRAKVINFGAGPSALPDDVLAEATQGLLNFAGTGIGITEISHRSKEFAAVNAELEQLIRTQLEVPPTHHILFMQGGGSMQFSAVVLNMLARYRLLHPASAGGDPQPASLDYVVTGSWSKKAFEEAKRMLAQAQPEVRVHIAADGRRHSSDGKSFESIPPHDAYSFSPDPALIYYCENETVDGVQFASGSDASSESTFPFHLAKQAVKGSELLPLVGDHSSSFMSRRIPHLADHAIIFAGAQKNIGPSGLTILIVREDCLVDVDAAAVVGGGFWGLSIPLTLAYKTYSDSKSLYNTPPTFAIYVAVLVLRRMLNSGGLTSVEEANDRKRTALYDVIKESEAKGIFKLKVKEGSQSWMNVVFVCKDPSTEKQLLSAGEAQGFLAMKGHRYVVGIRISIYNAITEAQVTRLVEFLRRFSRETGEE
ncbi:phosphoserine aminotransferase [Schizopora paradoxa]|uniref:phosphoserine transaminase n=1 Tax=Schizopora paradoxa TaxID=27342 RepID=A0A0H2SNJ9_9AGAM|nr:phosphoserine aminotransferase [Schizopora paradoxa]